jgi:hypothetical protein
MNNMNEVLEQEIEDLEQKLLEKREELQETEGEPVPDIGEKELLHDVVGEEIQQQSLAQDDVVPPTADEPPVDQPDMLSHQVQGLVNIAFQKTLKDAIAQAVQTNNAALIDAFHDALVDQLYDELVSRRKVEQPQ